MNNEELAWEYLKIWLKRKGLRAQLNEVGEALDATNSEFSESVKRLVNGVVTEKQAFVLKGYVVVVNANKGYVEVFEVNNDN